MTAMTLTEISEATGIPVRTLQKRALLSQIEHVGMKRVRNTTARTFALEPALIDPRTIPRDIAIEDAELLARDGVGTHEAARRIGYRSWGSLERALHRAGRHDIASRLRHNQTNN